MLNKPATPLLPFTTQIEYQVSANSEPANAVPALPVVIVAVRANAVSDVIVSTLRTSPLLASRVAFSITLTEALDRSPPGIAADNVMPVSLAMAVTLL